VSLVLDAFRDPERMRRYADPDWNRLIQGARAARLLGRLSFLIEDRGLIASCPDAVWGMCLAARYQPAYTLRQILFEAHKVRQVLRDLGCDLILLKGAAYGAAALPWARGRNLSDLDILVPPGWLGAVEEALLAGGWECSGLSDYDQRYYRDWMHELPPFSHPERGVEVDLHHTLLPCTGRLKPQPQALVDASVPLALAGLRVLCPPDMLLHTAAHLFYDGEIKGGFGDLVDIHGMILQFGATPGFWDLLIERAVLHQLGRPLYHAIRYAGLLLATPVPPEALQALRAFAPPALPDRILGRLICRVLPPAYPERTEPVLAAALLYARSHWLRMPPWLLTKHLARKALRHLPTLAPHRRG